MNYKWKRMSCLKNSLQTKANWSSWQRFVCFLLLLGRCCSDCGKDCGSARILTAAALSEAKQEPVGRLSSNWHDKYALPYHPQYTFVVVTHFISKCFRDHKRSHIWVLLCTCTQKYIISLALIHKIWMPLVGRKECIWLSFSLRLLRSLAGQSSLLLACKD